MANDLNETRERIQWCKTRSIVLAAEIDAFIRSGAYKMSHETDEASGSTTLFMELTKEPPRSLAIESGLIIHELRASLDGLACVLATRNGKGTKNVYFPVSRDLAVFEDDGLKRKLRNLSQADRDVIASLKPYADGNPMLFALHSADLLRKHQRLIMSTSDIGQFGLRSGYISSLRFLGAGPLTAKRQAFAIMGAGTMMEAEIGVDINLSEPEGLRGRPLATVLRDFTSLTESIIKLFD
ncbi:hypothetical protein [Mesorhizobium sp. 131-2-1]|uniref:hypothetical protein n=1 Tax=Mesorhizobium sp. 131-2-1 TaxID=2744518 RepID=UPI0019251922|nr:hypothetical protein [Mesorhizobium sp. 131-2-1]BCG96905.1 hypothetical protein MesoLj131a_57690 [Mesorhizobium sp. 131-2-1]